jgi:hypothetical protein
MLGVSYQIQCSSGFAISSVHTGHTQFDSSIAPPEFLTRSDLPLRRHDKPLTARYRYCNRLATSTVMSLTSQSEGHRLDRPDHLQAGIARSPSGSALIVPVYPLDLGHTLIKTHQTVIHGTSSTNGSSGLAQSHAICIEYLAKRSGGAVWTSPEDMYK